MILTDKEIKELLDNKKLNISPLINSDISESCIEIHISDLLIKYKEDQTLDYNNRRGIEYDEINISDKGIVINPGDFYLTRTLEKVKIPNNVMGWVENSGSFSKLGMSIHLCDAHIDPGFEGHITLQLKNMGNNPVKIYKNIYVGKLYFFSMNTDVDNPYRGDRFGQSHPIE